MLLPVFATSQATSPSILVVLLSEHESKAFLAAKLGFTVSVLRQDRCELTVDRIDFDDRCDFEERIDFEERTDFEDRTDFVKEQVSSRSETAFPLQKMLLFLELLRHFFVTPVRKVKRRVLFEAFEVAEINSLEVEELEVAENMEVQIFQAGDDAPTIIFIDSYRNGGE